MSEIDPMPTCDAIQQRRLDPPSQMALRSNREATAVLPKMHNVSKIESGILSCYALRSLRSSWGTLSVDAFENGRRAGSAKYNETLFKNKKYVQKRNKSRADAFHLHNYIKKKIGRYGYRIEVEVSGEHHSVRAWPTIQFNRDELLFTTRDDGLFYLHGNDKCYEIGEQLDELLGNFYGMHEKELSAIRAKERMYLFAAVALLSFLLFAMI